MENKIVKWEEGEYIIMSTIVPEYETPKGAKASKYDLIVNSKLENSFYVTKVEGENIFGYYLKGDSDER
jgi:hypothetical protein